MEGRRDKPGFLGLKWDNHINIFAVIAVIAGAAGGAAYVAVQQQRVDILEEAVTAQATVNTRLFDRIEEVDENAIHRQVEARNVEEANNKRIWDSVNAQRNSMVQMSAKFQTVIVNQGHIKEGLDRVNSYIDKVTGISD